jgi:hypothetical protein
LNHRHKDFQSSALPTELLGHRETDRSERSIRTFSPRHGTAGAGESRIFYLIAGPPARPAGAARDPRRIVKQLSNAPAAGAPAAMDAAPLR